MKKKVMVIIGVIVGTSVLSFGLIHSSSSQDEPSLTSGQIQKLVSEQYPGKVDKPTLKREANHPVYEVMVSNDDRAYEIKLDGHSGDILNMVEKPMKQTSISKKEDPTKLTKLEEKERQKEEKKQDDQKKKDEQMKQEERKEKKEIKTVITPEEAGRIALQQFSGTIDEIELEEEDGRLIYEVEIERGDKEAEIEIDAYTGEVIVIEIDED